MPACRARRNGESRDSWACRGAPRWAARWPMKKGYRELWQKGANACRRCRRARHEQRRQRPHLHPARPRRHQHEPHRGLRLVGHRHRRSLPPRARRARRRSWLPAAPTCRRPTASPAPGKPARHGARRCRHLALRLPPFAADRRGLVLGEGGAALVLEDWDAVARGARIHGELVGYGTSCDHSHLVRPEVEGQSAPST